MIGDCCDMVNAISEAYGTPTVNHERIENAAIRKNKCLDIQPESNYNQNSCITLITNTINNMRSLLGTYHDVMDCLIRVKF